jgi:hypothetical protein
VLNDACRQAGLPVVSLWANVPHYISEVSNPHAILALVQRVCDFLEWRADLAELEESTVEFDRQMARVLSQKPDVARYIEELERRVGDAEAVEESPASDLPNAGELIQEVEKFLREQRGERGQG